MQRCEARIFRRSDVWKTGQKMLQRWPEMNVLTLTRPLAGAVTLTQMVPHAHLPSCTCCTNQGKEHPKCLAEKMAKATTWRIIPVDVSDWVALVTRTNDGLYPYKVGPPDQGPMKKPNYLEDMSVTEFGAIFVKQFYIAVFWRGESSSATCFPGCWQFWDPGMASSLNVNPTFKCWNRYLQLTRGSNLSRIESPGPMPTITKTLPPPQSCTAFY